MQSSTNHIRELFDYLQWSDRLMLEGTSQLMDEAYYHERGVSLGSIHKLMVHLMAAEWIWLSRWRGESLKRIENHEDYPTREALAKRWPIVHAGMDEFLARQTAQSLAEPMSYRDTAGNPFSVPLVHSMVHVVDHGTYHRGQLNSMIKQAGGKPVPASYISYQVQKTKKA